MLKKVTTEVQIPAGVDDEMRVRIAGEGEPSPNGGPPGDCYCFISVLPHPLFERDGQNLVCRVPITYAQAALGTTLEVPTLEGRGEVEIPAGTQSGQVFKLGGKGMPDPRRRGLGDLLVQVVIEVPKKLSKEEQTLLRDLAELEHKHVAPERKSFFEKLKDYFTATKKMRRRNSQTFQPRMTRISLIERQRENWITMPSFVIPIRVHPCYPWLTVCNPKF